MNIEQQPQKFEIYLSKYINPNMYSSFWNQIDRIRDILMADNYIISQSITSTGYTFLFDRTSYREQNSSTTLSLTEKLGLDPSMDVSDLASMRLKRGANIHQERLRNEASSYIFDEMYKAIIQVSGVPDFILGVDPSSKSKDRTFWFDIDIPTNTDNE